MYGDGHVLAVPTANRDAYRRLAEQTAAVFREHGALGVVEGWGDDVPEGKVNSLNSAVLRKPDEAVVFSWVAWPDRAARDAGMRTALADPRMAHTAGGMPFDGRRMIFGGFAVIVQA
jgi:uncharacterized protein YbaA (DUF1428 family)